VLLWEKLNIVIYRLKDGAILVFQKSSPLPEFIGGRT